MWFRRPELFAENTASYPSQIKRVIVEFIQLPLNASPVDIRRICATDDSFALSIPESSPVDYLECLTRESSRPSEAGRIINRLARVVRWHCYSDARFVIRTDDDYGDVVRPSYSN